MEPIKSRRRKQGLMPTALIFYCVAFCFLVASALSMSAHENLQACSEIRSWKTKTKTFSESEGELRRRRSLVGPGSRPPRCATKCGKCTPCRAVHVAVPPDSAVTTEYYPEAWRCKCGNHLYVP